MGERVKTPRVGRKAPMKALSVLALGLVLSACTAPAVRTTHQGLVEYAGSQNRILQTGKAEQTVTVASMVACADAFGLGAVAGLDGEITVYQGRSYVTKVRKGSYLSEYGHDHGAAFAVWTCQPTWREEPIPAAVKGYLDLQNFVKARALAANIDATQPFPFRITGTPAQIKWHVNVDRTEGQAINIELYAKSKQNYLVKDQPIDIIGFYSEHHAGVFISAFAPAIPKESGLKNAIHIHMLTKDGKAAGHVDDIALAPGMFLHLPMPGAK